MTVNQQIRDVLSRVGRLPVPIAAVEDLANLRDAGLSSFAAVELMLALEDAFGIEFPEDMITTSRFSCIAAIAETVGILLGRRTVEGAGSHKTAFTTSEGHR